MKIKLTNFSKRHFDKSFAGTKILDKTPQEFEDILKGEISVMDNGGPSEIVNVLDGYAPFCKLLVVKNFTDARTGTMPITNENYQYLRSGYSKRTENELETLSRWFELPMSAPRAKYLVVILYSREQLLEEYREKYEGEFELEEFELSEDVDYGVVAILGQMTDKEEPMKPITMMRNSLGKKEGGSGVEIDREAYKRSVEFWSKNATVK